MTDTTDDTPEVLTGGEVLDGTRGPRWIEYRDLDAITYTPGNPKAAPLWFPASVLRRFADRVNVGPDDACWEWTGTRGAAGYGQLSNGRAVTILAHRFAYGLEHGHVPPGMDICHRCDNPPCCNPAHLFAGTRAENQHDKRRKGRAARGVNNRGGGRLTEDDVVRIRAAVAAGERYRDVGAAFGVSGTMVGYIARREQWEHVA